MQKILFNDKFNLTQAVLDGRKRMTRRIIPKDIAETLIIEGDDIFPDIPCEGLMKYSRYKVGEVVAIAQSYKDAGVEFDLRSDESLVGCAGWNNKMFTCSALLPHRIRITDIRVERLQDISDKDCFQEGIYAKLCTPPGDVWYYYHSEPRSKREVYASPREAFAGLIDKVSGKGTWESNPYVWVYSFELIK